MDLDRNADLGEWILFLILIFYSFILANTTTNISNLNLRFAVNDLADKNSDRPQFLFRIGSKFNPDRVLMTWAF